MASVVSEVPSGRCVLCNKETDQHCTKCADCPSSTFDRRHVFYCSKECQEKDRNNHTQECKSARLRNAFDIVVSQLQQCAYTLSKYTLSFNIDLVKRRGKTLTARFSSPHTSTELACIRAAVLDESGPIGCSESEMQALMLLDNSMEVQSLLPAMLLLLCEPLLSQSQAAVQFMTCQLKDTPMVCTADFGHRPMSNQSKKHSLLKCQLNNNEVVAVDFTGCQYGFGETIMTWERYESKRIRSVQEVDRLDLGLAMRMIIDASKDVTEHPTKKAWMDCRARIALGCKQWSSRHPVSFKPALKQNKTKGLSQSLADFEIEFKRLAEPATKLYTEKTLALCRAQTAAAMKSPEMAMFMALSELFGGL